MKHLFRATRMGWEKERDGIYFDADTTTREEAEAQFVEYQGTNRNGYSYTGYEYDGVKYHDYQYLGLCEDDKLPANNDDLFTALHNGWIKK